MISRRLIILLACIPLAACQTGYTPQPRATMFPAAEQQFLRSASHWDILARNEAQSIQLALDSNPVVMIRDVDQTDSPFEQAYRNMLITHLLSSGVSVALNPQLATHQVDYTIQVVRHEDRSRLMPRPGSASALFAVSSLGATVRNWSYPELALIPLGLGLDILNSIWRETSGSITEVIIHSRLHDGNRLISAGTHIYYFSAEDEHNFYGQGRTFPVVGSSGGH